MSISSSMLLYIPLAPHFVPYSWWQSPLFCSGLPHGSSTLRDVFPNFTYTLLLIYSVPRISSLMRFLSCVIPLLHHACYSFLIQYVLPEVEITCNTTSVFSLCRVSMSYQALAIQRWVRPHHYSGGVQSGEKVTGKSVTTCSYDSENKQRLLFQRLL